MIVFSSVSKQFLPDTYALKDVSFEINPGELVLLTGPSGSGKTTIMKLLTKELSPTSGEIFFHDVNLNDIQNSKIHEHRRKIGVVFQDYKLIPELNVWENIALPLSIIGKSEAEIEERVTDLLELVSLTDKALHFPKQLSGGEAQRIGIARALSTAPAIIFADEPTGNLDKDNSLQIAKLLTKINELGTTILFSTHDHDVIGLLNVHRHIVLSDGTLVSDTADKVKKTVKNSEKTHDKVAEKEEKTAKTEDKPTEVETTKEPGLEITSKPAKKGFWVSLFSTSKPSKEANLKEKKEGQQLELKLDVEPKEKPEDEEKETKKETNSKKKSSKIKKK